MPTQSVSQIGFHIQEGRYPEAERELRLAVEEKPNWGWAQAMLGYVLLRQGRPREALPILQSTFIEDPASSLALKLLLDGYLAMGQVGKATPLLWRYVAMVPGDAPRQIQLADMCYAINDRSLGRNIARLAHEIGSDDIERLVSLALCLSRLGDHERSEICSLKAIALDSSSASARAANGHSMMRRGSYASATMRFLEAISLDPNSDFNFDCAGNVLRLQGRLGDAVTCYERAYGLNPNEHNFWSLYSHCRALGRIDECERFEKIAKNKGWQRRDAFMVELEHPGAIGADAIYTVDLEKSMQQARPGISAWHVNQQAVDYWPQSRDFSGGNIRELVSKFIVNRSVPSAPIFSPRAKLVTFGSCFAAHLRDDLKKRGRYAERVVVPEGLNNTFALRQFMEWCLTDKPATDAYWYDKGADGQAARWTPRDTQHQYRELLSSTDGFVFTIGLAEVWRDRLTGGVFWRGVPREIFEADRHVLELSSVEENCANLTRLVELVREALGDKPIVFTLSPVPLLATHRDDVTCMLADCVSKSTLRVALDQVMRRRLRNVYYWPSFEIVRWLPSHVPEASFLGADGFDDMRHVKLSWVDMIIGSFVENFFALEA